MRQYTVIKYKGNNHCEVVSLETITGLKRLLRKIYTFYDEYTADPELKTMVEDFTADEIRQRLKIYGYYTVTR